jgi:hypothetical protein
MSQVRELRCIATTGPAASRILRALIHVLMYRSCLPVRPAVRAITDQTGRPSRKKQPQAFWSHAAINNRRRYFHCR